VTETRKLAAITAVDVVGYSRLMGEDEAGTAKAQGDGAGSRSRCPKIRDRQANTKY
jgi:hypothetical protein